MTTPQPCPTCGGSGEDRSQAIGSVMGWQFPPCSTCGGRPWSMSGKCKTCHGTGLEPTTGEAPIMSHAKNDNVRLNVNSAEPGEAPKVEKIATYRGRILGNCSKAELIEIVVELGQELEQTHLQHMRDLAELNPNIRR